MSSNQKFFTWFFGFLFVCTASTLAQETKAEARLLLDRPADAIGVNLGWEFPGAGARFEVFKDPVRGECRKIEYDFTQGGQYIHADFPGPPAIARTIRFWYKNPQPGKAIFRIKDDTEQHFVGTFDYKPGPWQEISIPLEKSRFYSHFGGANDGNIHLPLRSFGIGVEKTAPVKGVFFLSDLSTDVSGSFSHPPLRASIQPKPLGGVVFLNEKADYQFVLDNRLSLARKVKIVYRAVTDEGKLSGEKKIELDIAPFQIKNHPIPLTTSRYGYQGITARILVPGQKPLDLESGLAVVRKPQRYLQKDPDSFFAMIQDKGLYETNARLGAKNLMLAYNWQWLEPLPGKYILDDETPKQFEKYNLGWMIKFNHFTPLWAQWTKAPRPELRPYIAPEHLASFEKWIQTTVAHYKGKLQAVEIINEPDLGYWQGANLDLETAVDMYCKTLQAGYKAAKAADPNIPVWGAGVSGYDQESGMRFTDAVLKRAAGDLDFIGNHPYAPNHYIGKGRIGQTPEQGHLADKCRKTLDLLAQNKKSRQMYIGELGWALHLEEPALSEPSMLFAQMVAQAHIEIKSVPGMRAVYWFTLDSGEEGGYFYGLLRGWPGPMYPLPAACAYATCAAFLDHTDVVAPVKISPGIRAWRFDRTDADRTVVALWSAEGPITLVADFPAGIQIINSFGKTIAAAPKAEFPLDALPVYAVGPKTYAAQLAAALENAKTRGAKNIKILQTRLTSDTEIQMTLMNYTKSSIKAEVTLQTRKKSFKLQPGRQILAFGIRRIAPDPAAKPGELIVTWNSGEDRSPIRTDLVPAANLSGPTSPAEKIKKMMTETQPLVRKDRQSVLPSDPTIPWTGPEDLSMRSWIGWDEKDLYLAVEITDDIHVVTDTGEGFWMSDSLQIALDPANDSTAGYDANDIEFGFAKGAKENASRLTSPSGGPLKCDYLNIERNETKKTTLHTAAVPWTLCPGFKPNPGHIFALNIIANDNDGQGRACWIGLTPGIGEEKRPEQYLRFLLTP
jgi:hypothetical protein